MAGMKKRAFLDSCTRLKKDGSVLAVTDFDNSDCLLHQGVCFSSLSGHHVFLMATTVF